MRDKWYFHLAVGWYKLSVEERGFVSTLYSQNDELTADDHDIDTLFGSGWRTTATSLAAKRVILIEQAGFGVSHLKLLLNNAKRREYHRDYKKLKSAHVRTCTNHAKKD